MSGKTIQEPLDLRSMGFGNLPTGGLKMLDQSTAVANTNTWLGQIHLGSSAAISVAGPSATAPERRSIRSVRASPGSSPARSLPRPT